jgi:hypothetical protein
VLGDGGVGAGLEQADCESGCGGGFQEAASIHELSGKGEVWQAARDTGDSTLESKQDESV